MVIDFYGLYQQNMKIGSFFSNTVEVQKGHLKV